MAGAGAAGPGQSWSPVAGGAGGSLSVSRTGGNSRNASASARGRVAGKLSLLSPGWARGNDRSAAGSTAAKVSVLSPVSALPVPAAGASLSGPGAVGSASAWTVPSAGADGESVMPQGGTPLACCGTPLAGCGLSALGPASWGNVEPAPDASAAETVLDPPPHGAGPPGSAEPVPGSPVPAAGVSVAAGNGPAPALGCQVPAAPGLVAGRAAKGNEAWAVPRKPPESVPGWLSGGVASRLGRGVPGGLAAASAGGLAAASAGLLAVAGPDPAPGWLAPSAPGTGRVARPYPIAAVPAVPPVAKRPGRPTSPGLLSAGGGTGGCSAALRGPPGHTSSASASQAGGSGRTCSRLGSDSAPPRGGAGACAHGSSLS